jgi:hypothetical protein
MKRAFRPGQLSPLGRRAFATGGGAAPPPSYDQRPQNSVRRHRERAAYDYATVHAIVGASAVLHVSFVPPTPPASAFPTTLPMIGAACSFAQPAADPAAQPLDIYVHGHAASRLMRLPGGGLLPGGLPVCVAATLLDGIVLALTPFNHSCNYRSVVAHGYATAVTDDAERAFAMHRITDALVARRWANSRVPPTPGEMQATGIIKIAIATASAKIRAAGPSDSRHDLDDDDVVGRVWAGVIPVWQTLGAPVAGPDNRVAELPPYLKQWRDESNRAAEAQARRAAGASEG